MKTNYIAFDIKHFESLKSSAVKAAYLLQCEISTVMVKKECKICFQAIIGGQVLLPVWAENKNQAVDKAVFWLKDASLNFKTLSELWV